MVYKYYRLDRLDEMIIFNKLSIDQMALIVDIQLKELQNRLLDRKITLTLDKKAKEWLAQKGFDPVYGARPLKRVIQNYLQK